MLRQEQYRRTETLEVTFCRDRAFRTTAEGLCHAYSHMAKWHRYNTQRHRLVPYSLIISRIPQRTLGLHPRAFRNRILVSGTAVVQVSLPVGLLLPFSAIVPSSPRVHSPVIRGVDFGLICRAQLPRAVVPRNHNT